MIPTTLTLKGIWLAIVAAAFAVLLIISAGLSLAIWLDFHIGPFGYEGYAPYGERMKKERDECHSAGETNLAAQKAQKAAYEAKYKEMAHEADEQVERARTEAGAATERYARTHRVQRSQGGVSAPVAAPGDSGAGVHQELPAGVVVGEADVRACGQLYPYAVEARKFILDIANQGTTP